MLPLFPRFKLLGAVHKANQTLSNVDGLLSCGWWMVELGSFSSLDDVSLECRDIICHSLFFSVNWIREVRGMLAVIWWCCC